MTPAQRALSEPPDTNACGRFGDALQAAALKRHASIVKLLIDNRADVNQQTGYYGTAIQAAAYHGQHNTEELLLNDGAKDAFHAAAEGGHQDVIMFILQKGYKFRDPPRGPCFRIIS